MRPLRKYAANVGCGGWLAIRVTVQHTAARKDEQDRNKKYCKRARHKSLALEAGHGTSKI